MKVFEAILQPAAYAEASPDCARFLKNYTTTNITEKGFICQNYAAFQFRSDDGRLTLDFFRETRAKKDDICTYIIARPYAPLAVWDVELRYATGSDFKFFDHRTDDQRLDFAFAQEIPRRLDYVTWEKLLYSQDTDEYRELKNAQERICGNISEIMFEEEKNRTGRNFIDILQEKNAITRQDIVNFCTAARMYHEVIGYDIFKDIINHRDYIPLIGIIPSMLRKMHKVSGTEIKDLTKDLIPSEIPVPGSAEGKDNGDGGADDEGSSGSKTDNSMRPQRPEKFTLW